MTSIQFKDLGILSYDKALDFQKIHFEKIKALKLQKRAIDTTIETPNYFFFVSHPHVYTMGRNGNESNILLSREMQKKRGIAYFETNRGGDSTYHGPGQIVGYPILDLDNYFSDIHKYMRLLEEVIIQTLKEFGIKGERSKGETGVWLDTGTPNARKICAMGVHTSRWVTMHGFALNVNTDLNYFDGIIPCGIVDKGVTSLAKELSKPIDEALVKNYIIKYFAEIFSTKFINYQELNP